MKQMIDCPFEHMKITIIQDACRKIRLHRKKKKEFQHHEGIKTQPRGAGWSPEGEELR